MLTTILVLLALGGVTAGCLYTPDANGHVVVPDGVTSIGNRAFLYCRSLVSIALPEGLISIGPHAFHGATSLASVALPDSLTSIGDHAFYGATSLSTVYVPLGCSVGEEAFGSISGVTIPWTYGRGPPLPQLSAPSSPSPPRTDVTTAPPGHCCNGCGSTLDYQAATTQPNPNSNPNPYLTLTLTLTLTLILTLTLTLTLALALALILTLTLALTLTLIPAPTLTLTRCGGRRSTLSISRPSWRCGRSA